MDNINAYIVTKYTSEEKVSANTDYIENKNFKPDDVVAAFSTEKKANSAKEVLFKDQESTTAMDDDGLVFKNLKTKYEVEHGSFPGYEIPGGNIVVFVGNKSFTLDLLDELVEKAKQNNESQPGNE